ncbi:MAG: TetR family transcriptional regulator [Streptomyces sp.]|nr:TetR family transcriptional regulator [Streptomyces sp.]
MVWTAAPRRVRPAWSGRPLRGGVDPRGSDSRPEACRTGVGGRCGLGSRLGACQTADQPLSTFSAGIDVIAECLREWRPGQPLEQLFDRRLAADPAFVAGPERATVGALVRLTRTEPGLRAIWLQTYDEAEPAFARALGERAGLPADDLRPTIQAAMFNAALRAAVEHYAWRVETERTDAARAEAELADTMRSALAVAARGIS